MTSFLERFLGKPRPEDVTFVDLETFLDRKVEEHQNLEYKAGATIANPDGTLRRPKGAEIAGMLDLAKTVAGFANADGGLLVLGARQKKETHRGVVTRILPGTVDGVPASITREAIENQLTSKIQHSVPDISFVPVRRSSRHKSFVYLIDIPASSRAPHRVDERFYFQRYNFSTLEMKHYQIADLFGKRLAPDLSILAPLVAGLNEERAHFTIRPMIQNRGGAVAKYVTVLCDVVGPYEVMQSPGGTWHKGDGPTWQFATGPQGVVYPEVPTSTGPVELRPTTSQTGDVILLFRMFAENMTSRTTTIRLPASELPQLRGGDAEDETVRISPV